MIFLTAGRYIIDNKTDRNNCEDSNGNNESFTNYSSLTKSAPHTNPPPFFQASKGVSQDKSRTVFEVRTETLSHLPLVDFQPTDYGLPNQAFGFEAGPVCFK